MKTNRWKTILEERAVKEIEEREGEAGSGIEEGEKKSKRKRSDKFKMREWKV